MRDLLYQTFVRKARLLQAMTFRKFVARTEPKPEPIGAMMPTGQPSTRPAG